MSQEIVIAKSIKASIELIEGKLEISDHNNVYYHGD